MRAQREYQNNMLGWEDHADDFVGSYSSVGTLIEAKQKSENPSLRDLDTRGRERARQKIYPHRRSQSPPRLKDTVFEQGKELGKKTIVRVAKGATPEPVKILAKMMVPYIVEGAHGVKQGFVYIGDSVPGARTAGHFVKDVTLGGLELLDRTLEVMPTAMRRTARTLGLPQNWSQNIGDATHLLQEIGLIVMPAVKAIRMERATATAGEVARPKGITLTLEYKSEMDLRDFDRKVRALQDLAERGKLVKSPVIRDKKVTDQYRQNLLVRAKKLWKDSEPTRYEKIKNLINDLDVDHIHDLQLFGIDKTSNLGMLNQSVNRSIGSQVYHQLKKVPEGTNITNIIIKGINR